MKINVDVAKKALGVAAALVMGCVTVVSTLADQKKAAEFEDMKKVLSELQNK